MSTASPGSSPTGGRLFIRDCNNGLRFLIDTGAEISVLPPNRHDRRTPSSSSLNAVNGTSIPVFGQRCLSIDIGLRRLFTWIFTIADVSHPILGVDLLSHFGLQVDLSKRKLLDRITSLSVDAVSCTDTAITSFVIPPVTDPYNLLC